MIKKEEEEIDKYKELVFEIGRQWKVKPRVILYLTEIGVQLLFATTRKTALLGTAQILQMALQ